MSKDLIVLTPNGRRQKVHCTPDTSILQVLEDVCQKQGFQPSNYDLKHHNHTLDLTNTIRFSNLPNKATLEMVEVDKKREEANITIGLLLEDGERRTADFPPNTSLFDLITHLAPNEVTALQQPTILYMRQEVVGVGALQKKTLRQLGLIGGRAILRLLNKTGEARQANVSSVYRRPDPVEEDKHPKKENEPVPVVAGPSNIQTDPIKLIKKEQEGVEEDKLDIKDEFTKENPEQEKPMEVDQPAASQSTKTYFTQIELERRLKIDEEVTFIDEQKAIAFMQPDSPQEESDDLPDDFYELSIEEVRKLYNDLQRSSLNLENMPLLSSKQKEEIDKQTIDEKLSTYKNVVVRIQFPDRVILQGIFTPMNTIDDVRVFIKEHLANAGRQFHIYTTPIDATFDPTKTLLEARFVPCVHMHFKWIDEQAGPPYLREQIYSRLTPSDAASILASKYRARSRRKIEETPGSSRKSNAKTPHKSSKTPKWFK